MKEFFSDFFEQIKDKFSGQKSGQEKDSPIVPGEVFDPQAELERIRQLPREERRQELEIYKEKLIAQKEGIAETQTEMIKIIRQNPDASFEELNNKVLELGFKHGFSERQQQEARFILEAYIERRQAIKEIVAEHPDGRDLYELLIGKKPKGNIQVIEGPVSLYFRIFDKDDYLEAHRVAFLLGTHKEMPEDRAEILKESGGARLSRVMNPALDGAVIIEQAKSEKIDQQSRIIYNHEEQHAFETFFNETEQTHASLIAFLESKTDAERENALRNFWRANRQEVDCLAKNEILAYYKSGDKSKRDIMSTLTLPRTEGGMYDYFIDSFNDKDMLERLNLMLGKKEEYMKMALKVMHEVYRDEYADLVWGGLNAFSDLQKKGKFSIDKTIALLTHEPLRKWPTVVKRILEQK